MSRHRTRGTVGLVGLTFSLVLALAAPTTPSVSASERAPAGVAAAAAAEENPVRTKVRKFRRNWVFRSTKLDRCAFIEVTAKLVGRWKWAYRNPDGSWNHDTKDWLGFRLRDPAVHVTGWPVLGAGCDSTERWRIKATIGQGWYSQSCDLDVDVSVGYPWSVSATPKYRCGENEHGHTTSQEGPSRKTLHQYNSGVPLTFEGTLAPASGGVGYQAKIMVRMATRNASDRVAYTSNITIR